MKRRGLGKGLGKGYKNIVTRDSYIHGLSAKGVKTLSPQDARSVRFHLVISEIQFEKALKRQKKGTVGEMTAKENLKEIDTLIKKLMAKGNSRCQLCGNYPTVRDKLCAQCLKKQRDWEKEQSEIHLKMDARGVPLSVFNVNTAPKSVNKINKNIKAPVISSYSSTLGGEDRVTILISLSLDKRSTWYNDIYENSRYMRFHLDNDGTLEQFGLSHTITKKFRKTNAKSVDEAINKINKYISEVR